MMTATDSLRKDHLLIEKMINSLKTISLLLKDGKQIPESILNNAIDFSINFTNVCHHGKEEESLFPNLEKNGMPKEGGPIARMLYEHEITKDLANSIINATKNYISTGDNAELVKSIDEYISHVSLHLAKENQKLFVMADMILKDQEDAVNNELGSLENSKLNETGNSREYYEKLVEKINLQK
ncbi:MAG TPA: hemerythrin domain-containing protein [Candidatus Nitrosocosmicus sp.]